LESQPVWDMDGLILRIIWISQYCAWCKLQLHPNWLK
jgi:hypothetical protein